MKAIRVHEPGGPETLMLEELPTPEAEALEPGQALVRVAAAGVNFIDIYLRSGQYPGPRPLAIGLEGAGVVEAVGPETRLAVGAAVAWADVPGSYATHVVADHKQLVPIPTDLDHETAAAAMLQGMTAHYLARTTYPLASRDTCLIHAAAGGVGLLLVQLAKRAGARVIGTVGTEDKAKLARAAGADEVIVYTAQDFVAETRRLTEDAGVSVVYDSVGKATFEGSLDCLGPRGMMVLFGQASGAVEPLDPQVLNRKGSLYLTRPSLGHYIATPDALMRRAIDVLEWIAAGELTVRIDRTLPLEQAATAHELLASRATAGKLLLVP